MAAFGLRLPKAAVRLEAKMRTVTGKAFDGCISGNPTDANCTGATRIVNLQSQQTASLRGSSPLDPEVPAGCSAPLSTAAPLAPAYGGHSTTPFSEHAAVRSSLTHNDAVSEIEQAHDRLHRTKAMLTCLKMQLPGSIIGQYLDEATHTYVQALSRYQAQDLEAARDLAAASSQLSRLVEILISRTFHSNTNSSKLVPPRPERVAACSDKETVQYDLHRVRRLLARILWATQHGTLPSNDRMQVEKVSSWSEQLCWWANRLLEIDAVDSAVEFAEAAHAAACSAERLCRKCYVTRIGDPQATAST